MMNDIQRRILAEAIKYGGGNISVPEQMAKAINESPVLTGGEAAPTLFGWGKHQFEAKFRELLMRMGFERGIIHMKTEGQEMKMYFANAAKARDFVVAFNGLARRKSMGSVASVATQFNKIKAPTGTNAIVSLDLTMIRGESLDIEGTDLYEWFTQGGIQEAINVSAANIKKMLNLSGWKPSTRINYRVAFDINGIDGARIKAVFGKPTKTQGNQSFWAFEKTVGITLFLMTVEVDGNKGYVSVNYPDDKYTNGQIISMFANMGIQLVEETLVGNGIQEGAVKGALEDFMYSLPKAAIAEIKPLMTSKRGPADEAMRIASIRAILKKHKVKKNFMGFDTANLVDFYFNTFHGESVKEEVEVQEEYYSRAINEPQFIPAKHLYESFFKTLKDEKLPFDKGQAEKSLEYVFALSLNVKSNWSKYIKNQGDLIREAMTHYMKAMRVGGVIEQLSEQQQVIGKYRFTSFTEGSISGWMVSVQGIGEVGFIQAPAKKNTKSSIEPHKLYKTKGQSEGSNPELVMAAFPDKTTRFVNDKEIRFAPRQLLKAVAMWMDKHGKVMTEGLESVEEDGEVTEAKVVGTNIKKVGKPTKIVGMVVQDYEYNGKKYMVLQSFSGRETVVKKITPQGTVEVWRKSGNIQTDDAMRQYVTSSDFKEEVEVSEQFKAGDKVKVPHKGKMVSGKIVRFDDGGTSKAQQHGGGYVVDVGEYRSILVPKQEVQKEETVSEYRRYGYRSTSYSGDPRWITAKYAGRDSHGKPFKAGERVLYFPNGKKFYTGAEAEKAWLEFLSAKGDEEGMPFAR